MPKYLDRVLVEVSGVSKAEWGSDHNHKCKFQQKELKKEWMCICSYTDKESPGEHGRAVPLLPGRELGLADIGRMVIA